MTATKKQDRTAFTVDQALINAAKKAAKAFKAEEDAPNERKK